MAEQKTKVTANVTAVIICRMLLDVFLAFGAGAFIGRAFYGNIFYCGFGATLWFVALLGRPSRS